MGDARTALKTAMTKAGGVVEVANMIGTSHTSLYRHLKGADLDPETRRALRQALPKVKLWVWAELYAPRPVSAASESTAPEASP